jgi:hypothetical protein
MYILPAILGALRVVATVGARLGGAAARGAASTASRVTARAARTGPLRRSAVPTGNLMGNQRAWSAARGPGAAARGPGATARTTVNNYTTGSHNTTSTDYNTLNTAAGNSPSADGTSTPGAEGWRRSEESSLGQAARMGQGVLNAIPMIGKAIRVIQAFRTSASRSAAAAAQGPGIKYDAGIARSAVRLEVGGIRRDIHAAQSLSESTSYLIEAQNEYANSRQWFDLATQDAKNKAGGFALKAGTYLWDHPGKLVPPLGGISGSLSAMIEAVRALYGKNADDPDTFSDSVPAALFKMQTQEFQKSANDWRRNVGPQNMPSTMQ